MPMEGRKELVNSSDLEAVCQTLPDIGLWLCRNDAHFLEQFSLLLSARRERSELSKSCIFASLQAKNIVPLKELLKIAVPSLSDYVTVSQSLDLFSKTSLIDRSRIESLVDSAQAKGYGSFVLVLDLGSLYQHHHHFLKAVSRVVAVLKSVEVGIPFSCLCFMNRSSASQEECLALLPLFPKLVVGGRLVVNKSYSTGESREESLSLILDYIFDAATGQEFPLGGAQEVIDSMGDGVLLSDERGEMLIFNRVAQEIFGYELQHLSLAAWVKKIGTFLPDQVTPYPIEDLPLSRALRGENADQLEMFIKTDRRPNGTFVSATARPIWGRHGEVKGAVLVFRDISAQKRALEEHFKLEARVFQAQKLEGLGLLAGGIAHDFNNLLMGVLGNAGLVLLELPEESELYSRVEQIKIGAQRLAELTNQLLAYSGRGTLKEETVDLSALVQEMQKLLKTVVSKKAVFKTEYANSLPLIQADSTQLRQVVMNLITNASDALGEGAGTIILRTGRQFADAKFLLQTVLADRLSEGEYVYLEVADDGCGMSRETQKRIFDPFYTTKLKGRGLGLAAVLGLVRRHGGTIKVDSAEGKGTTIRVLLPAQEVPDLVQAGEEAGTREFKAAGTVLVIDDEELVREVTKEMLEFAGFEVLVAASGGEGLTKFHDNAKRIVLVILDMTMPDLPGEEVFVQLRRLSPTLKVIMSSGYSRGELVEELMTQGLAGYLQKPYAPEALLNKVRRIIQNGRED